MTSEIRVNKLQNRVGLGTVEYTNTGIVVSGIVTCTELSGLTALNIAGVGTANTLDINGDIDVDGHTNLDNVSIAGVSTFTGNIDANANFEVAGTSKLSGDVTINRTTALLGSKLSINKDADQEGIGIQLNQSSGITTSFTTFNSAGSQIFSLAHDTDGTPDLILKLKHSTDSEPAEKVRITSGGSVNIGGDYTQTSSKLKVTGTVTVDGGFALSAGTFTAPGGFSINSGNVIISGDIAHDADPDTTMGFGAGADTFRVQTAGSTRLHIHSDGRFRVGCTQQPSGTVGGFQLDMGSYPGTLRLMSGAGASGTNTASLAIGGSNYHVNLHNGANAGGKLDLYNYNSTDGNSTAVSFHNSNGLSIARILGVNISHSSRNGALVFMTSTANYPTEKMRLDKDGNLGINNTSPGEKIDVTGSVQASSGFKTAGHPIVTYASFTDISGGSYATRLGSTGTSTLRSTQIYGGGSHIATFDGVNNRLGINVTAPTAKLDISAGHYLATNSGKAVNGIHIRGQSGNSGEFGGGISFGCNATGAAAIAAEQMSSDTDVVGLAFFTHPTSTGSDNASKKMKIMSNGGMILNNWESNRGFIFERLGAGTYPDFPNVQGSNGRGICSGQRVISANTATEIARSHWGGLALVGYSNSQHQGTAQVMFGYGGAGASVRFSGYWVRQESLTISFTMSAYSLMISHNASNDLNVWCILIGV